MANGSQPKFYDLLGQLRAANQRIQRLEQMARQRLGPGQRPDARFARMVLDAREAYNRAWQSFLPAYRAVFGTVPSGLADIGQLQIPAIAGTLAITAGLVVITWRLITLAEQYVRTLQMQASTAQTVATTAGRTADDLLRAAAVEEARGNPVGAAELREKAVELAKQPPPGAPESFGGFLQKNWPWLAVGGLLAFAFTKWA